MFELRLYKLSSLGPIRPFKGVKKLGASYRSQ